MSFPGVPRGSAMVGRHGSGGGLLPIRQSRRRATGPVIWEEALHPVSGMDDRAGIAPRGGEDGRLSRPQTEGPLQGPTASPS